MMNSYTLNNWDGKLSNSDQQTTQNSTKGGSNTWEGRSHMLGSPSGHTKARNDVPMAENETADQTSKQTYVEAMTNITNDACNDGPNTRLVGMKGNGTMMNNLSSLNFVKATVTDERIDASIGSQSTTRTFVPIENSLLHAFHSHKAPTSPQLAKKLEAVLLAPPPPPPKKSFDVISVHTTDAEGDDDEDDEDVCVIQKLLISPSKLNESPNSRVSSPTYSVHNSLFTPPPSEGYPSADRLFTPEPPSPKPLLSSKRQRMMYVDVPPLPGPKSEYRFMLPRRAKKPRPPVPAVKVYQSLQDALQASIDNNSRGALSHGRSKTTAKKNKKDNREKAQNAVAGSSKHPIVFDSVSPAGTIHVSTKKRVHKEDEALKNATKKQKRTHVDIDLTLSDGENLEVKPKLKLKLLPPKVRPAKTVPFHDKENDVTLLALGIVKPIDLQIWDLNTRFLRASIMQQRRSGSDTPLLAEPTPRRKTGTYGERPWFYRVPFQLTLEEDEISLGGTIPTSWDVASGGVLEEESDDDEVVFVETSQVQQQHLQPPPPASSSSANAPRKRPIPRKIDLAARYRKKEKPKSKSISAVNKSPIQSFTQGLKPILPSTPSARSHFEPGPSSQDQLAARATPQLVQSTESDLLSPSTPSAKALGKRKAVDPEPYETHIPSRLPLRTFGFPSSQEHTNLQHNNNALEHFRKPNLDIFIHDYGPSPSSLLRSSANPYGNTQTLSSLYTSSQSHDNDILQFEPTFAATEKGFLSTGIDLNSRLGVQPEHVDPWDLGVGRDEEYQYSTVDPTLLGGSLMDPEPAEISESLPDYAADFAPSDDESDSSRDEMFEQSQMVSVSRSGVEPAFGPVAGPSGIRNRSPSAFSSPRTTSPSVLEFPSSTENMSEKEYVPSNASTFDPPKRKTRRASVSSSDDEPLANWAALKQDILPKRKKKKGSAALYETSSDKEYVPSTKLSLLHGPLSKRKTRRASSFHDENISEIEYVPSTTPAVRHDSPPKETQRQPSAVAVRDLPKRQRVQRQREDFIDLDAFLNSDGSRSPTGENVVVVAKPARKAGPKAGVKSSSRSGEDWPKEAVEAYCHQCRRKSDMRKMTCPSCNVKFCFRCLSLRYPDETFIEGVTLVWTENCPRCDNYCNCTQCCSRRGEQYISSRVKRPPGKRISTTPVLKDQPLPVVPLAIPKNVQYWATVYDLNGKRVGTTYASSSGDAFPSVVFARPTGEPSAMSSRKIANKRVFVGSVQRSWGFSQHPTIRDVNPSPPPKPTKQTKGKKIIKALPKMRHFVGSNKFIRYRKKPDPDDPFGDLSSLSSLTSDDDEDDIPAPEESETDVEVFNPESLTDRDVCRAITLGLQACGLRIVNGPTHTLITSL